jgi:hypothetical protein
MVSTFFTLWSASGMPRAVLDFWGVKFGEWKESNSIKSYSFLPYSVYLAGKK